MKLVDLQSSSETSGHYRIEDIEKNAKSVGELFEGQDGVCLTKIHVGFKYTYIEFTHNYEMCPVSRIKQLFRKVKRKG